MPWNSASFPERKESVRMAVEVRFKMERETKNTVRFEELHEAGEPAKIGTLYVQKWALNGLNLTKDLQVTIDEA
jgi:hypothetical protein